MMFVAPTLLRLAGTWALAQATGPDAVRMLAAQPDGPTLVAEVRARPADARDALGQLFALSVAALAESDRVEHLAAAERIAQAFLDAWQDSFYLRQVGRFARAPPATRAAKVTVDSLRRAGNEAFGREGFPKAARLWRASLWRARAGGDTAGMAAALGNLGAGLYREGQLDSAAAYLERARQLAEAVGDRRVALNALGALASVSKDRGQLARASELYSQALDARQAIGDMRGAAADRNNLGLIAQTLGDLEGARAHFEEALALNRRHDYAEAVATNLTNLAGLAAMDGEFARAGPYYRDALAIYRELGSRVDAAFVLRSLGLLELRRGDYPAARRSLEQALAIYDETGPLPDALAVQRELAQALAAMGDLQGALGTLRRAEAAADSARAPSVSRAGLALARGDVGLQLNDLAEAEREYLRAEGLSRAAGDRSGQAAAQQGRGFLLLLREDYARAGRLLELARRSQAAAGDQRSAALTRLLVAEAQRGAGDTAGARQSLEAARRRLDALGDPVSEAAALAALGDLAAASGTAVAAESLYQRGLERLGARPAADVSWRLHAGLGLALRARGALEPAVRELRAAVVEVERVSAHLAIPERRAGYLADKWDVYAQLALAERARDRTGAAFEASERLRARQLLDLLARGRVMGAPADSALLGREQDLRRRIGELTDALARGDAPEGGVRGAAAGTPTVTQAGAALARTQEDYASLLLELRETSPGYASVVAAQPASWRAVAAGLAPDEAMVEYLLSDSGSVAFVITRDTIGVADLDVRRRDLARLVDFARAALGRPDREPARTLWRAPLRQLHEQLVAPVERTGLVRGTRRLLIAPHGELHYLPFGALLESRDPERFLIERYDVVYVPSASVWLRLVERRAKERSSGVLALAPRPDALPASRLEVEAIGRLFEPASQMLVGGAATEASLRAAGREPSIVHLATYGVLNKHNPLFSYVDLNPGGDHDGRLEVHEVFDLALDARLVVLSACQTAVGSGALADVPAGDDWVGLVQGFLSAGAAQVLATLWPVEDRATARLVERFYAELARDRPTAAAIAEAQRWMRQEPATAHPFYWAGFVLVGGR